MSNLNETAQLLNVAAVAGSVRRTRLIKAATLGEDGALDETVSRAVQNSQDARTMFNQAGALEPPYEPDSLCMIIEHSSNLRQNIDGYVTNIDGFGHHYEPQYSLDNPEIAKEIRAMVEDERAASNDSSEVTDQAIQERLEALRKQARREYLALRAFFDNCTAGSGYSFIKLRRLMRQDLEVGGNAFWEATRDRAGRLKRLVYVPAHTMRLMPLDKDYTLYTRRERKSPTAFETVTALKRFRRYVQVINGISTYFKEFGDPRYLSKTNGMYAKPDADAAKAAEDHATEIIHFAIHSPRTPYGVPRWIGALLAVLGSRSSEEVNYDYFENKSIPPLAILVSGGRLAEGCVDTLKAYIEENIKGKKNFHRILLLEAEEAGNTSEAALPKISIQPLTEAQYKEELFTRYDERNASKIGQTFRLPPILRGETPATLNRATAVAAIRFAEEQVFEPERSDFDFLINSKILPELDVAFWNFVSNSPVTRDPEIMTTMVTALVSANVLTPNEGRLLASDIFNRSFTPFSGDWANQPIGMGGGLGMPFSEPASEEKAIEEGGAASVETKQTIRRLKILNDIITSRLSEVDQIIDELNLKR